MKTPDIEVDDRTAVPKEATTPQQLMDSLLKFDAVPAPVVSLYLDARVNEHGKRVFLPFVRKQLSERLKTYPVDSEERASIEEDFVRIMRYLEDGVRGPTQGVAVFACSALDDYFQVGQFEAPFERNRLVVSERPHVYPLARLIDQYRHYAVVLADTNRAQIFVFAAGRVVQQDDIQNVKTKHTSVGGWSQARYQRHEENYHLQHAKEVVDALERTLRDDRIEHVILAGDEAVVIPILKEQMSKELQEKVVDTISLGIDTPEHEVLEETLTAFRRHDSLTDMQKVEQLLGEFRGDNLAVAGVPDTLAALSNGQVEEMLIVAAPSPPVPAVSTRSVRSGRTGRTCARIASAQPAISSAVSPFRRSATRKPPICAGVASPRITSCITSRACSRESERPSRSWASAAAITGGSS